MSKSLFYAVFFLSSVCFLWCFTLNVYLTLPVQNMIKSAKAAEKQQSLVKVLEQEKKTLEHEINAYRQKAQQERKIIQQLEKERDRYINENGNLIQKAGCPGRPPGARQRPLLFLTATFCVCPPQVQQKMSDNEVREGEIYECKKKVTEAESKIKQQEHVLESVVGERNLYSKNLIEAQVWMPAANTFFFFRFLILNWPPSGYKNHSLVCF